MSQRVQFPQWRAEHEPTKYPFARGASLTNGSETLLEGTLLDASLYPVGGGAGLYLSRVVVTHDTVTLYVGDPARASGSYDLLAPPDAVELRDAVGRPAGLLVSEAHRLALVTGWGVGDFAFLPAQTAFAATCCVPTPQAGVRGVLLDDGSLLTGDVWLVGGDGVVLRHETVTAPDRTRACGGATATYEVVRVDVVGDPLYRRRLCQPSELFETPRFVRQITFVDRHQSVVCRPNSHGDMKVTVNNDKAPQPVLRVHPTPEGNLIEVVGSLMKDVR